MKRYIQIKTGKEYNKVWKSDKNTLIEILPQLKNSFEKTESREVYKFMVSEVELSLEDIEKLSSKFDSVIIGTDGFIIKITLNKLFKKPFKKVVV